MLLFSRNTSSPPHPPHTPPPPPPCDLHQLLSPAAELQTCSYWSEQLLEKPAGTQSQQEAASDPNHWGQRKRLFFSAAWRDGLEGERTEDVMVNNERERETGSGSTSSTPTRLIHQLFMNILSELTLTAQLFLSGWLKQVFCFGFVRFHLIFPINFSI